MKESKLIAQLRMLNKEEFKRFYLFLQSPYFTRSKDVIQLFDLIRRYYPSFESKHLEKELVFKKLFPKEEFSDIKLRNLQTKLSKVLESYLIQLEFEQDDFEKKKKLTQIYGKRNYYYAFRRETEQLLENLEATPFRDATYFYDKYSFLRALYFHEETHKYPKKLPSLKEIMEALNNFYAIERLYLGVDLKNREKIFSEKHDFNFEDYAYVPPTDNLIFQLYHQAYRMLDCQSKEDYIVLKNSLLQQTEILKKETAEVIFYLLVNFAHQNSQSQPDFYLKELFQLNEYGLNTGIVMLNDTLYLNTVSIAAANQEFTWARAFIEKYENTLDVTISESTRQLARSQIYFNEADYYNVIETLKDFNNQNILYVLNAKFIIFRSLYKLMEKDSSYFFTFMAYADAFERFLNRKKVFNQQKKEKYLNLIRLVKKIIKLKENGKLITPDSLVQMVRNRASVAGFNWLMKNL